MGVVMLVALLGGLMVGGLVAWHIGVRSPLRVPGIDVMGARSETRPPSRALAGAVSGPPPAVVAAPTSPPAPQSQAQPTRQATPSDHASVAKTDGVGVVLRASPRDDDWTPRGFMDGDAVTILERQGDDWARIRGPNNQEGWVPTRYLSQ